MTKINTTRPSSGSESGPLSIEQRVMSGLDSITGYFRKLQKGLMSNAHSLPRYPKPDPVLGQNFVASQPSAKDFDPETRAHRTHFGVEHLEQR